MQFSIVTILALATVAIASPTGTYVSLFPNLGNFLNA